LLTITVPKSLVGTVTTLTELHIDSVRTFTGANVTLTTDRAPDGAAFGTDYALQGANGTATSIDTDADGLNDTWEQSNFGNLTQDGKGDSDTDGCDNKCEFDHGTNPKKADTDGDGVNDGDEVKAGTDPNKPDNTATTSNGPSGTTSSGPGGGGGGSGGGGGGGDGSSSETKASPLNFIDAFVAVAAVALVRRRLA
ncbi:MAG: hypothetical protein ABR562_06100, partial [Thermoplasmatota archaeon]